MKPNGMPPRVDVIIPAFNSAASICEAVDSALAQTFQAIAVLVVDDGSTDDTREVVTSRFGRQSNVSLLASSLGRCAIFGDVCHDYRDQG